MKNFTFENKQKLINWWNNGKQDKPLINVTIQNSNFPNIADINDYWEKNEIRFNIFIERLKTAKFYGVGTPVHYVDFGASAMAGALGCKMNPLTFDTIWPSHMFSSFPNSEDIYIKEDSNWYKNLHNLFDTSLENSQIITTFYALGGVNDTLGSLYGEDKLMMDMYDRPEEVKECLNKICDIWIEEANKMYNHIKEKQDGMAGWAGVWAPGSTFPIQDDISFMLSTDIFEEFCLPYIKKCVDFLDYPMYHLDGPGAVKHLDCLLEIEKLKVIQWIPGAGKEEITQWYGLIRKILDSGKSAQVFCNVDEVDDLVKNVGTKGLLINLYDANNQNIEKLSKWL
jgi:hypothetical protein